jgi:hypothetical protein
MIIFLLLRFDENVELVGGERRGGERLVRASVQLAVDRLGGDDEGEPMPIGSSCEYAPPGAVANRTIASICAMMERITAAPQVEGALPCRTPEI